MSLPTAEDFKALSGFNQRAIDDLEKLSRRIRQKLALMDEFKKIRLGLDRYAEGSDEHSALVVRLKSGLNQLDDLIDGDSNAAEGSLNAKGFADLVGEITAEVTKYRTPGDPVKVAADKVKAFDPAGD